MPPGPSRGVSRELSPARSTAPRRRGARVPRPEGVRGRESRARRRARPRERCDRARSRTGRGGRRATSTTRRRSSASGETSTTAEGHARRALSLALSLGDRMHIVFAAPSSQSSRLPEVTPSGPGCSGAPSRAKSADGRVGQWETASRRSSKRSSSASTVRSSTEAMRAGSLLSIAEAAGLEPEIPV